MKKLLFGFFLMVAFAVPLSTFPVYSQTLAGEEECEDKIERNGESSLLPFVVAPQIFGE